MTGMDLFNAIDGVDEALLDDVHDEKPRRSAAPLLWKFAAAAAAVALCVGVGIRLISLKQNGLPHRTTAISGSASSGTSSAVVSVSLVFDSETEPTEPSIPARSEPPATAPTSAVPTTAATTGPSAVSTTERRSDPTRPSPVSQTGADVPPSRPTDPAPTTVPTVSAEPQSENAGQRDILAVLMQRLRLEDLISPLIPGASPSTVDVSETERQSYLANAAQRLERLFGMGMLLGSVDLPGGLDLSSFISQRNVSTGSGSYILIVRWDDALFGGDVTFPEQWGDVGTVTSASDECAEFLGARVIDTGLGWYFASANGITAALIASPVS